MKQATSPDFVGLSDVAAVIGVSRQNMRKLMVNSRSFPPPVHEGSTVVWHLADILSWLDAKGGYDVDNALLELAMTTKQLNFAKESRQQSTEIPPAMWALTA